MRKYITFKNILLFLLFILIVIQFFRPDQSTQPLDPTQDFLAVLGADDEITKLIKTSCYDCHSNQTKWPWYSSFAPISWWVADHVSHGKGNLNFSEWSTYELRRQNHKMEEAEAEVKEGHMPLRSYLWVHKDARLTADQRAKLSSWFLTQIKE